MKITALTKKFSLGGYHSVTLTWLIPDCLKIAVAILLGSPCLGFSAPYESESQNQIKVLWRHELNNGGLPIGCQGAPAIGSDGSIYVPAGKSLYALTSDGSEKWKVDIGDWSVSDVALDKNGTIYVTSTALYAFASDGALKWKIPGLSVDLIASSVALGNDGSIYFMRNHKLCAANSEGTIKWERETSYIMPFPPVIGPNGAIYAKGNKAEGNGTAYIQAFVSDGTAKWSFDCDRNVQISPLAIDDVGILYFGAQEDKLYALDDRGQLKWVFKGGRGLSSSPAIGPDGTIYFGSGDGNLYAVNRRGELKWKVPTGNAITSAPAVDSEGNIYFASRDSTFYCVGPNGSLKGSLRISAGYGSPVIGPGGTIYYQDSGCIYAFRGLAKASVGPWPMKRHDAQGTARGGSHNATNVQSFSHILQSTEWGQIFLSTLNGERR
jgi:outer membrane protein assembly factor BamB